MRTPGQGQGWQGRVPLPCVHLSLCLFLCLCLCLSVSLSTSLLLFVSVSLSLSVSVSISPSLCLSISLFISLLLTVSTSLSLSDSISPSLCLSLCYCLSLSLGLFLSLCLSMGVFVPSWAGPCENRPLGGKAPPHPGHPFPLPLQGASSVNPLLPRIQSCPRGFGLQSQEPLPGAGAGGGQALESRLAPPAKLGGLLQDHYRPAPTPPPATLPLSWALGGPARMLESRKQSGEPAAPSRWAVRPPGGVSVSPELVWFRKDPGGPRGVWAGQGASLARPISRCCDHRRMGR